MSSHIEWTFHRNKEKRNDVANRKLVKKHLQQFTKCWIFWEPWGEGQNPSDNQKIYLIVNYNKNVISNLLCRSRSDFTSILQQFCIFCTYHEYTCKKPCKFTNVFWRFWCYVVNCWMWEKLNRSFGYTCTAKYKNIKFLEHVDIDIFISL